MAMPKFDVKVVYPGLTAGKPMTDLLVPANSAAEAEAMAIAFVGNETGLPEGEFNVVVTGSLLVHRGSGRAARPGRKPLAKEGDDSMQPKQYTKTDSRIVRK